MVKAANLGIKHAQVNVMWMKVDNGLDYNKNKPFLNWLYGIWLNCLLTACLCILIIVTAMKYACFLA